MNQQAYGGRAKRIRVSNAEEADEGVHGRELKHLFR
jgi:hypothetical protein